MDLVQILTQKKQTFSPMALYHKHRPQTFDTVIHQEHITTTLKNQITGDHVAHAYLFSGPYGVGKTTTARILAKSLNCTNRKADDPNPCGECDSCKDIAASRSIDVIEIDAASQTGVDNVRENIIENAQFKPTRGKYKIFIVDEVHMLSTAAFNALLKTLEEPPQHVVFILATTDAQKLPVTVVSRCQRFTFSRVPDDVMYTHIAAVAKTEGFTIDDEIVTAIVRKARGGARDAINLLDQLMALGDKHITTKNASFVLPTTSYETQLNFLSQIINKHTGNALEAIQVLIEQGTQVHLFMEELVNLLRILIIGSIDPALAKKEVYMSDADFTSLQALCKKITARELVHLTDRTIARMNEVRSSPLPHLPLELLVVEWSSGNDTPPSSKLVQSVPPVASTRIVSPTPPLAPRPEVSKPAETKVETIIHADIPHNPPPEHIDFLEVKKAWSRVILEIEKTTPSLVFILKNAELVSVEHGNLNIKIAYSFHQDKIMEPNVKRKIQVALETILGYALSIEASVDDSMKQAPKGADLNDLAQALGGTVVA